VRASLRCAPIVPRGLTILQQAALFSATVLLFLFKGYGKLSPDVADQAVTFFSQVSQHLVGISGGTASHPPPPPPTGMSGAVLFEPSSSVVRATTLWVLSLCLNMTCALWVLWRQWWQPHHDPLGQSGKPHCDAPARAGACHSSARAAGRFSVGNVVEVVWLLLNSSVLLFFVGLVEFFLPVNRVIAWILLGYLVPLAFLYAWTTLLPCHFLSCR
jgi:hypothetical protein